MMKGLFVIRSITPNSTKWAASLYGEFTVSSSLSGYCLWFSHNRFHLFDRELSGDILPDLRTPLLDITNKKLANPAFECCLLHSQAECDLEKEESINSYNTNDFNGFDGYNWVEQNYMDEIKNGGSASRALWLCFLLPCLAPLLINAFL
jgi:hypothetical protein